MPNTSAQVKIDAVREYGATADLIDVKVISRQDRVNELAKQHPDAYVASAYDDDLVIEGNSTLGIELGMISNKQNIDYIIAPIGGGGLTSGILKGLKEVGKLQDIKVIAAEPLVKNGNISEIFFFSKKVTFE